MPGKGLSKWAVLLLALMPIGCRAFCDHCYPCHPAPAAYPAYPAAGACCPPPCCPPGCAPAGYQPTNAYQQGTWAAPPAAPQTRLSPCVCE
jgi:hypothetical protein